MNTNTKKLLKSIYIDIVLLGIVATITIAIKMDFWFAMFLVLYMVLIALIYYFKHQMRITQNWEATVATVVGYRKEEPSWDDDTDKPFLRPRFEFTVHGQAYSVYSDVLASYMLYKVGEKVNVHYNPDNPQEIKEDSGFGDGFFINTLRGVLLLVAVSMILAAIILFLAFNAL